MTQLEQIASFVTNRTYRDVVDKNARGTYSFALLNRINTMILQLSEYAGILLTAKTDFEFGEEVTEYDLLHMLENLASLRHFFISEYPSNNVNWYIGIPAYPLDYDGFNTIEKLLLRMLRAYYGDDPSLLYAGEKYIGES